MEQTLIVSSLARNVTVRCIRTTGRISVDFETIDTSLGLVHWNFFPVPAALAYHKDRRHTWVRQQQMLLGRLVIELQKVRISEPDMEKVLTFITGQLVEWVRDPMAEPF